MPNKNKQKKPKSNGSRRSAYHATPGEARRAKKEDDAEIARETRQNGLTGKHPDLLKRCKTKRKHRGADSAAACAPLDLERYYRPTPQRRANSAAAAAKTKTAAAADVTAAKSESVAEARKRELYKQFIGMTRMP